MVAWAVFSIARLPPLDGPPPPREGGGILDVLSIAAIALFAFAAVQLVRFFRYRGETILLATAAAVVLLAEALIAILVSQNWHYSWWEWHLLLLAAFLTIALAARNEYRAARLADRRVRRAVPRGHARARRSLVRRRGGLGRGRAGRRRRRRTTCSPSSAARAPPTRS